MQSGELTLVSVHELHPHAHLMRQYSIATVACLMPLFVLLYWLTIPNGPWLAVLLLQGLLTAGWAFAYVASKRARIDVGPAGIVERGFFGCTRAVDTSAIGSVISLELYRSGSLDTHPQLFVIDAEGHLLLRMRGLFWSRGDMETVMDALGAPIVRVPEPLSLRDLNRLRPELLYWFERRFIS